MLSKTCVKAVLLLIPPGAAARPVPLPRVCFPQLMQSICICLGGRGCALTLLCWRTPEQNPFQDVHGQWAPQLLPVGQPR